MNTEQELRDRFKKKAEEVILTNPYSDTEELNEEHEMVIKYSADFWLTERRKELEKLRQEVEGMKKTNCGCPPFDSKHDGPCRDEDYTGYNKALSDVLALINSELK